jgi:hypothetical protein
MHAAEDSDLDRFLPRIGLTMFRASHVFHSNFSNATPSSCDRCSPRYIGECSTIFLKGKANTHQFPVLHFSTSVGYKDEIILLANLVYFMYAWYRDGHIVRLCRVCCSFVYAIRGEWSGKQGTEYGTWRSRGSGSYQV